MMEVSFGASRSDAQVGSPSHGKEIEENLEFECSPFECSLIGKFPDDRNEDLVTKRSPKAIQ